MKICDFLIFFYKNLLFFILVPFFSNWFGSLSGIEISKFELLEAVLRSGGQEKPPNPHTHVILIVKNPSMTYFLRKKNWSR